LKKVSINMANRTIRSIISYPTSTFGMFWLGNKDAQGRFKRLSGIHQCRETFCGVIKSLFPVDKKAEPKARNVWQTQSGSEASRQFRVAVVKKYIPNKPLPENALVTLEGSVKEGCRLVNVVNTKLHWGRNVVYSCKEDDMTTAPHVKIYVMCGSGKWMRSIQLVSLHMLIFRFGFVASAHTKSIKTFDQLMDFIREHKITDFGGQARIDFGHLKTIRGHLPLLLDNVRKVFFSTTQRVNFDEHSGYHGIRHLIESKGLKTSIGRAWIEVKKKEEVRLEAASAEKG
jgi:hypothetical protein